nr:hypothetical protein [Asgard group archaeon]
TNGVIHLKRNTYFDDWSGITPYFEDIYLEFYSNKEGALLALAYGAVDMVDAQFSTQLDEIPAGTTYSLIRDPGQTEMAINNEHPYLGNGEYCPIAGPNSGRHIRKAISHMVPRDLIVSVIVEGLALPGVTGWSCASIGFNENLIPYSYDIQLARHEMELAGFDYGSSSFIQTYTIGFEILVIPVSLISGMIVLSRRIKRD